MREWSRALTDELNRTILGLAGEIGLEPNMDGEAFETALGEFLAWSRALPIVQSLRGAGYEALGMTADDKIDKYFTTAISRANQATNAIRKVLFELFGRNRFSQISAGQAYGALLERLNVPSGDQIYLATTNYDPSLELAFQHLGLGTETGEIISPATGQRSLNLEGILGDARPNRLPILYLHGRVGWYVTPDGTLLATDSLSPYTETFGEPAILLPDPKKDYSLFAFTETMWHQFHQVIGQASKILVLGHSLNDHALVQALKEARIPTAVGISIWPDPDYARRQRDLQRLQGLMPSAHILPIDFGPTPTFHEDPMTRWRTSADRADLHEFANP